MDVTHLLTRVSKYARSIVTMSDAMLTEDTRVGLSVRVVKMQDHARKEEEKKRRGEGEGEGE